MADVLEALTIISLHNLHIYKCLLGLSALYRYENQSRSIKDIVYTLMDLGRDHEMAREDLGDILNRCKILLQG